MTTSKGPWQFVNEPGDVWRIKDADGKSIMGDAQYYPWTPEHEGDWQLMAAAWEMRDALRAFKRYEDAMEADDPYAAGLAYAQLKQISSAALAKAER